MLRRRSFSAASRPGGDGLYPLAEAARLLHVRPVVVRRWSRLLACAVHESAQTPEGPTGDNSSEKQTAWSFLALVDLLFVERFLAAGRSLQEIALVAKNAAERFESDHPFATRRFKDQPAGALGVWLENGKNGARKGRSTTALEHSELSAILSPLFEKLEYNGSTYAARYWPLGRKGRVVLDPKRKYGQPIDATTRVPTETLFDAVQAGGGQDANVVAVWFDVPFEAVQTAVRFEKELRGK